MPSTRPATPGPSNVQKRTMSDLESSPQDQKKPRRNHSAEPSTNRDSNRDAKRRRRKKKKAPIIGAPKDDIPQPCLDDPPRPPLSARNHVIKFTSPPPELNLPPQTILPDPKGSSPTLSSKLFSQSQAIFLPTGDQAMSSAPKDNNSAQTDNVPGPSTSSLEDKVTQLEAELKSKNTLIASHHALLNQVQQAVTCQVCLDLMYKPYALAPCGHLACHDCLVNWFTAPLPDNRPTPPPIMRRKTCPHCRTVVRERPIEVWGVKSIAQATGKSGLVPNQLPVPPESTENANANVDPWKDIFPKSGTSHRGFPWFFSGTDIDEDDIYIADAAPRGEDVGMLDMEDGGIYRCLDCMHEIWDGVCTSCGRVYPGHRPGGDDEDYDENPMGWLEGQMGGEEIDMVDDPAWVGLDDGDADDDGGDIDEWRPWRRQVHMFRGPWGFLGTIHVDEEDAEAEDDTHGRVHDIRIPDEDEESGDDDYESSFIDDDDDRGGTDFFDGPRFFEVDDDEHRPSERDSEDEGVLEGSCGRFVVSSDEESRHGAVESDGSEVYYSD